MQNTNFDFNLTPKAQDAYDKCCTGYGCALFAWITATYLMCRCIIRIEGMLGTHSQDDFDRMDDFNKMSDENLINRLEKCCVNAAGRFNAEDSNDNRGTLFCKYEAVIQSLRKAKENRIQLVHYIHGEATERFLKHGHTQQSADLHFFLTPYIQVIEKYSPAIYQAREGIALFLNELRHFD